MEVQKLRCANCGAPLPEPKQGSSWVKCEYCGYTSRVVDASKYVESLRQELEKWIRDILPPALITSTTVDVAARYQIFQSLIKPRVSLIRANVRAKYLQYLSQPITPFIVVKQDSSEDSKRFFEEALKVESLKDFAVSVEDQKLLTETVVYENLVAYLANMFRALGRSDYRAALKNCEEALQAVPELPEYSLVKERLKAVFSMLSAINELWNRNASASLTLINSSISMYSSLLQKVSGRAVPEVNPGVLEMEKLFAESLANVVEAAYRLFTTGEDPLKMVEWFDRYIPIFNELREAYRRPAQDLLEVTTRVKELVLSKTGLSELSVVRGQGVYYIPYYVVEVRLSYIKGFLLRKGAESSVKLMVSGIAPIVERPVIDVLGLSSGRPVLPDRIEEAPALRVVDEILSRVFRAVVPSRSKAVPPLIASVLVEKFADSYITNANDYYRGKIKFASTSVSELAYIPFTEVDKKTLDFEGKLRIRLNADLSSLESLAL
ncbi:MAG: hypothetical protein QW266_07845 [Sulfolobales archaeon]